MEKEDIKKIQDEIDNITEFTCSFYYPLYEESQKWVLTAPNAPEIIWNTIKTRSNYVQKLREKLKELSYA